MTSQDRNERSSIRGDHCVVSQTMSFELCIAAHGCLHHPQAASARLSIGEPRYENAENSPAEQNDDGVALGGNESEDEDVLGATRVAFGRGFAKGRVGVQGDLLVLGADEVVHDVRAGRGPARVAEPLVADQTLDDAGWVVDAAVAVDPAESQRWRQRG